MSNHWGFDVRDRDTSVRPQDDFYRYANGGWMKRNAIPASESRWGTFMKLRYDVDHALHRIIKNLLTVKRVAHGSPEQIIRDLFTSGLDMKQRNALGLTPLASYIKAIRKIATAEELLEVLARLERIGAGGPWSTYIDQDDKNSTKYALRLIQSGLGMPDRDYYLNNDRESKRVRAAYEVHVEALYRLIGRSAIEARQQRVAQLALETKLARISMSKEDRRDPYKMYHKKTIRELSILAPSVDWNKYLSLIGAKDLRTLIVSQPEFIKGTATLLTEVPLETWKNYLEWHLVSYFANALSSRFVRQNFSFYGTVLTGAKKMKPLWRQVLRLVNFQVGELLGKLYVKEYFTPAAKKKMLLLVEDLFAAYEARLKSLAWMSPATRKKALRKLRALTRKIGYPDKWRSYKGLLVRPGDYVGNIIRITEFEHRRDMRKLLKPVDRSEWFMSPQTVNAYFSPNLNDIVFPAAILQPPFFNLEGDDAVNYGAIGAVIGHEITHGFDDEGSKFDAKGNLKSWWTPEDRKRFEARAAVLKKQFDQYEVAGGIKVNGKLTLGENIADLGGVAIALDAYLLRAAKSAAPEIDGLSPLQRFFLGFAVFECENSRPEVQKMQVLTDPHSPGVFRINGPVSNLQPFYDAFGVRKGDTLYRAPKDRAAIW
jgi:putative endopeptidase